MKWNVNYVLIAVFVLLSVVGVFHHELSLDEARPWLVMKETPVTAIVSETRCEFHCLPWFYFVKTLQTVSSSPVIMQLFTVILGSICFGLIALFAPFTIWEKALLLGNYYFLFEYNLLSRPYVLMTLGMVLVCFSFPKRREKPLIYLASLLFLENSVYFGMFLTVPFIALFLYETYKKAIQLERKSIGFLVCYFLLFIWYTIPATGNDCFPVALTKVDLSFDQFLSSSWDSARAFFLIATDTWNAHVFDNSGVAKNILSFLWWAFILFTAWNLRKRKELLFIFSTCVLLIFTYRFLKPIYFGSFLRHMGTTAVFYVGVIWLFRKEENQESVLRYSFLIFLLPGTYSGLKMFTEDFRRPFGHGKDVHEFLSRDVYKNYEILPDSMFFTSTYLVYSDRKYYNYLDDQFARYFPLSAHRQHVPISPAPVRAGQLVPRIQEEILRKAVSTRMTGESYKGFLITNYKASDEFVHELQLKPVTEFVMAINPAEDYYIYERR